MPVGTMDKSEIRTYIKSLLENIPEDWIELTTHRLDIYNESLAKTEFIQEFENLVETNNLDKSALNELPTSYDYIRLGHPLSSVLEWTIANLNDLNTEGVISFSSRTMPVLAVLRTNALDHKATQIAYKGQLPDFFDAETLRKVYGYEFEWVQVESPEAIPPFAGSTIYLTQDEEIGKVELHDHIDFHIGIQNDLGSIVAINSKNEKDYISSIQHVRRRESIAMTPSDCFIALNRIVGQLADQNLEDTQANKAKVLQNIAEITHSDSKIVIGSSGLSVQYAVMMGLVEEAVENHPGKDIKFLVPPNCYGGTNDQARRVAESISRVEVLDLPVDREHTMDQSVERVLDEAARLDAVPYIIAEIPTNPRVEVPDREKLKAALTKERKTPSGDAAIKPVFILDQTFCPNVNFLGEGKVLSKVRTLAYVSGSKFPSGGKCTAGYCAANAKAAGYMAKIEKHMKVCDNEATDLQIKILAEQLPSMNRRITEAYVNTREFVNFIEEVLPNAKINFVSEELAERGFTPSVFSLDLPTKGETEEERENYKRVLNHKLINKMITQIPGESKYCVSYGQLKGCYWTIPATSTQGTTKEGDKDYIARVSVSPNLDLEKHKEVFKEFVEEIDG